MAEKAKEFTAKDQEIRERDMQVCFQEMNFLFGVFIVCFNRLYKKDPENFSPEILDNDWKMLMKWANHQLTFRINTMEESVYTKTKTGTSNEKGKNENKNLASTNSNEDLDKHIEDYIESEASFSDYNRSLQEDEGDFSDDEYSNENNSRHKRLPKKKHKRFGRGRGRGRSGTDSRRGFERGRGRGRGRGYGRNRENGWDRERDYGRRGRGNNNSKPKRKSFLDHGNKVRFSSY